MKVLFVTHVSSLGGANRSMLQLLLELRQNHGVIPYVIFPDDDSNAPLARALDEHSVPYQIAHFRRFKEGSITWMTRLCYIKLLVNYNSVYKSLPEFDFDIVHTNSSVLDLGVYLSKRMKAKHIIHLREFGYQDFKIKSILGETYERFIYSNCDRLIAISKAVQNHFSSFISRDRIEMIYNGIPAIPYEHISAHNSKNVQFVCVGWVNENKNQFEIVKAVDVLVNQYHCRSFHLTIIGPHGGDYYGSMVDYIVDRNIQNFVTFLGEQKDVSQLLSVMDVGITPSNCEAFGRTTVEYMLHSLAVIANDAGANTEIISNEMNGFIYRCGNVQELSNHMYRLTTNKEFVRKMGVAGREYAIDNFSSLNNSRKVYDLYSDLIYGSIH